MRQLSGKVSVVTGGASGIGKELARAFLQEGMKVVVADVEEGALRRAVEELEPDAAGHSGSVSGSISGEVTDVTSPEAVESLAAAVYERHGACHVLCNNAGVGAPSSKVWATTPNDWRWVLGVNVLGVAHGIQAFVPRMLEGGEEGHVVNTSSPDGPIAPLPAASVYAASKSAVSTLTECLAAQLLEEGSALRASIFYPSGGLLRTGLWTADRNRPAELARERPRETTPMTPDTLEEMARQGGHELQWQPLDELARLVVEGIMDERYVIMLDPEGAAGTLHERADAFGSGHLPPGMEAAGHS